jgi:hypothetical protein
MSHLVNHLGHFPMGAGPAQLYSTVKEMHDQNLLDESMPEDLSPDIFNLPNVQFFVLNNTTLVSYVEIPALVSDSLIMCSIDHLFLTDGHAGRWGHSWSDHWKNSLQDYCSRPGRKVLLGQLGVVRPSEMPCWILPCRCSH